MAATFQALGNRGDHPKVVEAAGIETSPLLHRLIYSGPASLCYQRLAPMVRMLWLLVGHGVAIESRHHVTDLPWQGAWDVNFLISSRMTTLLYQVAVGNIVTGIHIADDGYFQCLFQWMLRTHLSGFTGYTRAPR